MRKEKKRKKPQLSHPKNTLPLSTFSLRVTLSSPISAFSSLPQRDGGHKIYEALAVIKPYDT